MVFAHNRFYVQEVRYSGFAGRLYGNVHGCTNTASAGRTGAVRSRLITSGTCYLAKTGYVQEVRYSGFAGAKTGYVQRDIAPMAAIVESKFLSLLRQFSFGVGRDVVGVRPVWKRI